jgi:hypothetical protein
MLRLQLKLLLSVRNRVFGRQSCYKTPSCHKHIPKRHGCVTCTQFPGCCKAAPNLLGHETSQTATQPHSKISLVLFCRWPHVPAHALLLWVQPLHPRPVPGPHNAQQVHTASADQPTQHTLSSLGGPAQAVTLRFAAVSTLHTRVYLPHLHPRTTLQTPCIRLPTAQHSTAQHTTAHHSRASAADLQGPFMLAVSLHAVLRDPAL